MTKHPLMSSFVMFLAISSHGQDYHRFELGLQTTRCVGCIGISIAPWALGPVVTFNINRYVALDGAVSFSLTSLKDLSDVSGGRSTQLLAGPKFSIRGSRFALFAKGRPGLVRWSHAITGVEPGLPITFSLGARNLFAANFVGGFQYALNSELDFQVELGDTVVREVNGTGISQYRNNIQATSGIAYQLGALKAFHHDAALPQHKFLDRTNVLLFGAGLLAQSADAVTTQRRLANCRSANPTQSSSFCAYQEGNPLARPFVTYGWGGQIAISGIATSAEVLLMYGIHRMGYHTVERVVPVAQTIANSQAAYRNLQH